MVAGDRRLSEVLVGLDIEEGTPPALAQKKEKEEKGDSDDEEASGPDPAKSKNASPR